MDLNLTADSLMGVLQPNCRQVTIFNALNATDMLHTAARPGVDSSTY